ncbi:hypothetical protein [Streptomyces thermolilacinus]|uniref:Uncharacterized protein n=1 Tax=Streptomyces thermolilacinus SPC6 TaxID=1306406 RepID=A0A1D3DPE8_9ACTN|nr:hypothetical protein [Streptomyces thermolilacinus]OEJ94189.1 hypothetical protein J116_006615 [Streptomyces thermolilacinus SPC6]
MLALRLARGSHPFLLLRRLLVAAASAGAGFLLLCALAYAVAHPDRPSASALRLAWCALPMAAAVHLAVAVARTDPSTRPRPGLSSIGLGPARLAVIAAASTAVACTLGSTLALLFFLHLRGDLTGLPFDGDAADLLGGGQPLPLPAALTLLALVPVIASAAVALTLRPTGSLWSRRTRGGEGRDGTGAAPAGTHALGANAVGTGALRTGAVRAAVPGAVPARDPFDPVPAPAGLPWGVALMAAGLALELYGARGTGDAVPLPGGVPGSPVPVLAGWALTALGLAVVGPGLAHLCGRLLQAYRPGATRLLAGRGLMAEARRIGRPLGVLCAVVATGLTANTLYAQADTRPFGPLSGLGATVVLACAAAALFTAVAEVRQQRAGTTAALLRLGAPAAVLRSAALLRGVVLLAGFAPLTWLVAALTALPLRP